jgi:hypothetical protein
VSAARGPSSKTEGIVIVATDVTELMAARILRASRHVDDGNARRRVAHEVRTPLFALGTIDAFEAVRASQHRQYLRPGTPRSGVCQRWFITLRIWKAGGERPRAVSWIRGRGSGPFLPPARPGIRCVGAEIRMKWTMPIRRTRLVWRSEHPRARSCSPPRRRPHRRALVTAPDQQWIEVRSHHGRVRQVGSERAFSLSYHPGAGTAWSLW